MANLYINGKQSVYSSHLTSALELAKELAETAMTQPYHPKLNPRRLPLVVENRETGERYEVDEFYDITDLVTGKTLE